MSRMTSVSSQAPDASDDRFSVMLAHFAFREPETQRPRSILCRVLDGRGLDEVCPSDAMILTPEERAHYHSTLKNPHAHALAVRSRAELRRMLGRETGLAPQKVPILCDGHGKPRCPHPGAADLDFSVSRADDCAIIALGESARVGVDVEQVLDEEPSGENLEILFSEDEFRNWAALNAPARRLAFTQAWTIKEAALKAIGMGLDGDAHEMPVRFDESGNAWPVLPSGRWIFERIHFCPRYAASFIALMPKSEAPLHSLAA
jgi:4'-phosphopantetheinyl transferase